MFNNWTNFFFLNFTPRQYTFGSIERNCEHSLFQLNLFHFLSNFRLLLIRSLKYRECFCFIYIYIQCVEILSKITLWRSNKRASRERGKINCIRSDSRLKIRRPCYHDKSSWIFSSRICPLNDSLIRLARNSVRV